MAVALGGALGASARYGLGLIVARLFAHPFPWATWAVNLCGCFFIGLLVPLLSGANVADQTRFFLITGFLGSFTTFSTFSLDTMHLWTNDQGSLALLNVAGSVVLGLLFVWIGFRIGQNLLVTA